MKTTSNKVSEKEKWPDRLALYLGAWGELTFFLHGFSAEYLFSSQC